VLLCCVPLPCAASVKPAARFLWRSLALAAVLQVGVAGLCLDSEARILAIKEKNAVVTGYKLPGGLADPGEDLAAAAEREVREETGVTCKFHSILAFRQQHGVDFGVSDLFFVARCSVVTTTIRPCNVEIAEARWMPIEDYCRQTSQMNACIARAAHRHVVAADPSAPPQALDCDIVPVEMESLLQKGRTFQLFTPAPSTRYFDFHDPWFGQPHLSVHLLPEAQQPSP
jgi:ADP-ribose pyrophosphatase YjhB (NUDIX family)